MNAREVRERLDQAEQAHARERLYVDEEAERASARDRAEQQYARDRAREDASAQAARLKAERATHAVVGDGELSTGAGALMLIALIWLAAEYGGASLRKRA
jgi:hypothetical protein